MTMPMAVPTAIAIAKATATRASVIWRWWPSSPLRACSHRSDSTAVGVGSRSLAAAQAATCQMATKPSSDRLRSQNAARFGATSATAPDRTRSRTSPA